MYGHAANVARFLGVQWLAQQAGWYYLVAVVANVFALRLSGPLLERLGTALTRVAAVLIAITLVQIVPNQATVLTANAAHGPAPDPALPTSTTAQKRDVYWFIFECLRIGPRAGTSGTTCRTT